jgi:hypothetical protein
MALFFDARAVATWMVPTGMTSYVHTVKRPSRRKFLQQCGRGRGRWPAVRLRTLPLPGLQAARVPGSISSGSARARALN